MSTLNPQQKSAVLTMSGPVLVIAGAGAGKTKTLTERILNLIKNGVEEKSILAVTFTNKASKEMSERIALGLERESLNPFSQNSPFIGTFHSLGTKIIRENAKLVGLKNKNFEIFDRNDSLRLIKKILKAKGLDSTNFEPSKVLAIISKRKGDDFKIKDFEGANNFFENTLIEVWKNYEKNLKEENALDFDDLLVKTLNLLENDEKIRSFYQDTWQYIHIDEYQDTNKIQYKISKILSEKHKNIFAVGDADQNIYSWRGADIKNILNFEKDYPGAKIILLEQNYRSSKTIISVANKIIAKNKFRPEKNLFTENELGEKVGVYGGYDEKDEANFISLKSVELIDGGIKPEEIAVLYRANFQSRALEEAFMASGLPFQVIGTRFFERKEIKDIMAFLKAALNSESFSNWERIINIPPRGIGKITLAKLYSGMEKKLTPALQKKVADFRELLNKIKKNTENQKVSSVITFIFKESKMKELLEKEGLEGEERLENIRELVTFASRYDNLPPQIGLQNFLDDVALQSDQDTIKERGGGVKLMTVHASKGLEFDVVFVSGLEDKLFPHSRNSGFEKKNDLEKEEERRLFYVALTRARKKIILTYAGVRTIFGQKEVAMPSEFIFEIGDEFLENEAIYNPPRDEGEKVIYFEE